MLRQAENETLDVIPAQVSGLREYVRTCIGSIAGSPLGIRGWHR